MKNKYINCSLIVIGIILLDQISKYFIDKLMEIGQSIKIINNFFSLTYSTNTGAGFGIFQDQTLFLILLGILILIYILFEMKKNINNKYMFFAFCLLIGGLFGNLIDRIVFGYVRDFFDFIIFGYDFAIFNISDIFITISIIILLILMIKDGKNENKNKRK